MKPQPLIVLDDVAAGSRWFQDICGLRSGHGGSEYEMLLDGDDLVAQLHSGKLTSTPRWATPTTPRGATA